MADELIRLSAVAVRALLRRGEVTPGDLVEAAIDRIEAIDGTLNALPTRCFDRARAQAATLALRETMLGGLPLVIKDNNEVGGVRSTGGTPIFADRVPAQSDRTVALIE
ncbi:MAG: amidase family protein, partial [Ferrovibrionaceae bacterium]